MPSRPTRYFVEVVNRTKLEAALRDLAAKAKRAYWRKRSVPA